MALPNVRPLNEWVVTAKSASIGSTPVAAFCVAPVKGRVVRTFVVTEGTLTGTLAVSVGINGGSDIGAGGLSVAAGAAGSTASDTPANAAGNAIVNEGDTIAFTPSGATGSSIPGCFHAVIRE